MNGGEVEFFIVRVEIPGPTRSFLVKKNHFGSAVSEILRYRQKSLILYVIELADAISLYTKIALKRLK